MKIIVINLNLVTVQGIIYMSNDDSKAIYFISVASTLSGIHQQTIRTYEQKGLIKPFRTGGGTRRYSQEDIDKLIQNKEVLPPLAGIPIAIKDNICLLYTSPSPRDSRRSRMPSSA